ncbi:MAG: EAL domain-containing protein [Hylemonella sp.]|nr:EAL domain-containing protein [Hylemonella sp.]
MAQAALAPWKLAVIDDDQGVHDVTRLVLAKIRYKDRPLQLFHATSAAQGRELLGKEPDIAVVLLDVVMETEHAGLDLVKFIREKLDNTLLRIILRTGQPGQAPEGRVIVDYDINDYKEKSDLSAQKLVTSVTTALRGYDDLLKIQALASSNERLETQVQERTAELSASNKKLQRHKALLDEAQKIASIGNYEWNLVDGTMEWSDQIYRILGVSPQDVVPNLETLLEKILVDDYSRVNSAIRMALTSHQPYNVEHPIRRGDGSTGFVNQQGEVHYNDHGEPVRLVGVMQDITERHQAGESMRKLSAAVEQTADSVMITDREGIIEYVNVAFTKLTGYESGEACGQTPRLLKSDQLPEIFYRRLWNVVLKGEVFSDVIVNKRKDGSLYHEARTITPQRDRLGNITHFISTGRDISDQIRLQARMQHLAHHDGLTGLPNRILLADRLEQAMTRSKWRDRHVAVLFLDMDRFKLINDTLGHATGDQLLKAMAKRLVACVRDGDTVARLGGDEFSIVLNDVATREDVILRAQKVLEDVKAPFLIEGRELFVTTSMGISMYPQDGDNSQVLLKRADVAMYNAKAGGKNNFQFYTDRDEARELARLGLETGLRRALERKEFFLVYQPLVETVSRKIIGMETLLRWQRPEGEIVPPTEFIGLLEETGMILPVGDWVLKTACAQAQALRVAGLPSMRVAVNISPLQFRQPGFAQRVREVLQQTGLAPELLDLEITEGVLVDDVSAVTQILEDLNAAGVRLSIDDFGTGYSSMHYLRRLPFDTIKIDKSFIDDLPDSKDAGAIVTAIITLAHSMELEVIAEGVETPAQLEFVRALGCHATQGYLFSKPVSFEEIGVLLGRGGFAQPSA